MQRSNCRLSAARVAKHIHRVRAPLSLLLALLWLLPASPGALLLPAPQSVLPPPLQLAQAAPARATALHAPAVLAKSAYLLDASSGAVLFQKFPDQRRFMASTTKIMTGLLAAESGRLDETATVSRRAAAVGETTMGLVQGEQVSVSDLLYGLMLPSGNDAAIVLAEHLAGSVEAFADLMNERAAALGLADTHYVNPHGLDHAAFYSPDHYSSAHDLAVLGAAAMNNPIVARVVGTTMREVPAAPGKPPHQLRNLLSQLWWYPGAQGIKTGWTERAGQVRVVAAQRAGTRLVAVVMDSPDEAGEIRDLLDYGFASSGTADAAATVPVGAESIPAPDARLAQAWQAYKQLALGADGRVRRGPGGADTAAAAQAEALLHAVWFRDRTAFDAVWGWTSANLSRRQTAPGNTFRDQLFAGRWSDGAVSDWSNSTAADERIAAALLLASRLWNEPRYAAAAKPVLDAILNKAAISWDGKLGAPAANSFLKELEPMTVSAAEFTPAFYRMFAEASRNSIWLWLVDGAYVTLDRAASSPGPLGAGVGLVPSWFSIAHADGAVGAPVDPAWQTTGFGDASPALVQQLALDLRWNGDPRAQALLQPTARVLALELSQRQRIAAAYTRGGTAASAAETAAYGALAGIAFPSLQPQVEAPLRVKLEAALTSRDPDRILSGIDGLWLLAGGPPNYWRIWWPPEDLPTTRNDGVVPPAGGAPWRYFVETGHVVQGRFLGYFDAAGQIGTLGLPRTDEIVEEGRLVQYFQRGRLEYHPERAGTPGEVALASLGTATATARGILSRPEARSVAPFESDEGRLFVPETGHGLLGGFRAFYEASGGAAVLGFPITEELQEDGFTVQYFERGVLDYQPGKPIQPELLGDDLLRQKGWLK